MNCKDDDAALSFFKESAEKHLATKDGIPFFLAASLEVVTILERQKKIDEAAKVRATIEAELSKSGADGRTSLAAYLYDRAWEVYRETKDAEATDLIRRAIETYETAGEKKTALSQLALPVRPAARRKG